MAFLNGVGWGLGLFTGLMIGVLILKVVVEGVEGTLNYFKSHGREIWPFIK